GGVEHEDRGAPRARVRSRGSARIMIDIGANLTNKAFREDTPAVLERAARAGVTDIVVTGVSAAASRRAWEIASDLSAPSLRLFATAGFHPHHAKDASTE